CRRTPPSPSGTTRRGRGGAPSTRSPPPTSVRRRGAPPRARAAPANRTPPREPEPRCAFLLSPRAPAYRAGPDPAQESRRGPFRPLPCALPHTSDGVKQAMSETALPEKFGANVFSDRVMKERLPKETYKALRQTIDRGAPLKLEVATVVANAMKD